MYSYAVSKCININNCIDRFDPLTPNPNFTYVYWTTCYEVKALPEFGYLNFLHTFANV